MAIAFGMVVVFTMYYTYIRIKGISFSTLLAEAGFKRITIAFTLLVFSEVIRAVRLHVILDCIGLKVSFKSVLVSRFVGNTAGLLSPGNIAAEPARVLTLASIEGLPFEGFMAGGLLESLYDFIALSSIAIMSSLVFLPYSIPVIIVSVVVMSLWAAGLTGFIYKESIWSKIVDKFTKRLSSSMRDSIFRRYKLFTRFIKENTDLKLHAICIALTIAALLVIALSFTPLAYNSTIVTPLRILDSTLKFLEAYSMGFIMSTLPTPGGSGFFEYGLNIILTPHTVALWRMTFIIFSILPTLTLVTIIARLRRKIISNLEKSLLAGFGATSREGKVDEQE